MKLRYVFILCLENIIADCYEANENDDSYHFIGKKIMSSQRVKKKHNIFTPIPTVKGAKIGKMPYRSTKYDKLPSLY